MATLDTTSSDSSDSIKAAVSYEKAVQKSIKSVRLFFIVTGLVNFLYAARTSVWIEYAKTFEDFSHIAVSFVLYFDSILIGIVGTFFASLADYIGFDKSITYKLALICIGCIFEAFATNFKLLCTGFIISQTATQYVATGYISWILPKTYAKIQISLMYAVIGAFYLMGPLFSGILFKICNNYKVIFVANSVIMTILLLVCLIFLHGKQKKLELVQVASCTELVQSTPHPQDKLFPSYIVSKKTNCESDIQNNDKMSVFQWYIVLNILIEYGLLCFAAVFITFYLPFIIRKYPNDDKQNLVLVSSIQIVVVTLSGMISTVFISKYTHLYNKYTNPNLLLIVSVMFLNISCILLLTNTNPITHITYWMYCILIGIFISFPHLILEFLLIELQPAQHAGKINGIKAMILNIIRGVYLLFIGLLWNVTLHSILYVVSVGCVIIVILNCVMWILQKYVHVDKCPDKEEKESKNQTTEPEKPAEVISARTNNLQQDIP